ncbi:MAG: trimethylamine methyltransferase family protein [Anaerolineales bacterium]|jgi:trimethylamine--corrinoid protein Co-methyltransferase
MKKINSKIEILTQDEIEQIHQATLEVLSEVGVRFPQERILAMLEERGALVDRETGIARLPKSLVEQALRETRPTQAEDVLPPYHGRNYKVGPGNQANIVDYKATSRRQGTTEDVIKGLVLCNELPYVGRAMPLVTPADIPGYMGDLYGYYLCTLYSKKPYGVYICSPESAKQIIRMWEIVRDEPSRAGFDPHVGYLLEPNGSLSFDRFSLEMAMIFAEAGHNIHVAPMAMTGLDAPVTLAGTMVMQNAYNLAGIVFTWLIKGTGDWSGAAHSVDMRSMLCSFGSPNQVLIGLAAIQLGGYYGYQIGVNSGLTDACIPDFQSGFEKGMTGMVALLAGAAGIGAQGIVGADQGTSFEQLVIDNEWASAFSHIFELGVEVNEETLGVDVIKKVGVSGSFIAEDHTVKYARDTYWKSELFNQASWEAWNANGAKDVHQMAHEKVEKILAKHYPPEVLVSQAVVEQINAIIEEARDHPERFEE